MRLENNIVLITGSARGIGRSIAELFHKEGATVLISDIRDEEGLMLSKALQVRSEYLHLDVKFEPEWQRISEYIVAKYGKLDTHVGRITWRRRAKREAQAADGEWNSNGTF